MTRPSESKITRRDTQERDATVVETLGRLRGHDGRVREPHKALLKASGCTHGSWQRGVASLRAAGILDVTLDAGRSVYTLNQPMSGGPSQSEVGHDMGRVASLLSSSSLIQLQNKEEEEGKRDERPMLAAHVGEVGHLDMGRAVTDALASYLREALPPHLTRSLLERLLAPPSRAPAGAEAPAGPVPRCTRHDCDMVIGRDGAYWQCPLYKPKGKGQCSETEDAQRWKAKQVAAQKEEQRRAAQAAEKAKDDETKAYKRAEVEAIRAQRAALETPNARAG